MYLHYIREKSKRVECLFCFLDGLLAQLVHHLDQWQEHRDDDAADDDGEKNDHDGFH